MGARSVSRPTLWLQDLWQGAGGLAGGVADTIQNIFPGAVGEDLPGMEGPGGVGGEEELCGGRDVGAWKGSARGPKTPEGWPFLRHSMILGK